MPRSPASALWAGGQLGGLEGAPAGAGAGGLGWPRGRFRELGMPGTAGDRGEVPREPEKVRARPISPEALRGSGNIPGQGARPAGL